MTRYEFEVLSFIEHKGKCNNVVRQISDTLCISGKVVTECLESLQDKGWIRIEGETLVITENGAEALEPYRVRRAVILAAGFGSRMMPATADRPKPLVTINGVRIIDTLLDALVRAGIEEITVIGGYQFGKWCELLKKYPFLRLIENKDYASTNNISSAMLSFDTLRDGAYLCEADLFISNPEIIRKYQYASNILGSYSLETDDWSFRMQDGYLTDYKKGNTYCYNYYGISYWTAEDCDKLRSDFKDVYNSSGGKDYFWEFIPFVLRKEHYKVEIRPCLKQDVMEIDNYYELSQLDPGYI